MVPTGAADVLALLSLVVAGLLGAGVGLATRLARHRRGGWKAAAFDVLLAVGVLVAGTVAVALVESARGVLGSEEGFLFCLAAGGVVLRNLLTGRTRSRTEEGGEGRVGP